MAVESRKKRIINDLILTDIYKYSRNELHQLTLTELEHEWQRYRHISNKDQLKLN